jgi:anti-anti-sigma regulatory factor
MQQPFNQGTIAVERAAVDGGAPVTIVRLAGEHDIATAGGVRRTLDGGGDEAVIVDLIGCTFADSSIIAALLTARRERPAFAVVMPADPASAVARAFDVAGVAAHLTCCASLDEALGLIEIDQRPPAN